MRTKFTASDIIHAIGQLPKNRAYNYINPSTRIKIETIEAIYPQRPILINRYNPSRGQSSSIGTEDTIYNQMIWRIANSLSPNKPINIDGVLVEELYSLCKSRSIRVATDDFLDCFMEHRDFIVNG